MGSGETECINRGPALSPDSSTLRRLCRASVNLQQSAHGVFMYHRHSRPHCGANLRNLPGPCSLRHSQGRTHLSLNDVQEEVWVPAAAQQVAKAQGLVEGLHLVQDVRGWPPGRASV